MSYASYINIPTPSKELSGAAAIVGLGETNYHLDYASARQAAREKDRDYVPPTAESLATQAFEQALADAGLQRDDIDGLSVSFLYGGPDAASLAGTLGLKPDYLVENYGIMAGPIPRVCAAIAEGKCDTVAMIYAAATRTIGRKFGGRVHEGGFAPASYYYYHPWGWSSQAAHWAFAWQHYQSAYGIPEGELAAVAMQLREHALATPHAIMRKPLTRDDYLKARYVVRPLRLMDLCLVNDGGVCLIIQRADMARDRPHKPVQVAGWGEGLVKHDKLNTLVRERLRPQFQASGEQAMAMAGVSHSDIGHFECYDASTAHLINHVEGHGFADPGTGLERYKAGEMTVGGVLPVNMAGGMLSGSYMHGWNHIAEITRQLRHGAGQRQIQDVQVSMFSLAQTDQVHPLIFKRGA